MQLWLPSDFTQVVGREDETGFNVTAHEKITILVENMGYIGFSKAMLDYNAGLSLVFLNPWKCRNFAPLPYAIVTDY